MPAGTCSPDSMLYTRSKVLSANSVCIASAVKIKNPLQKNPLFGGQKMVIFAKINYPKQKTES